MVAQEKDLPTKKYCEVNMFKDREDKRFIKIFKEGSLTESIQILLDTETGVNYIHLSAGYGISLTPLLDSDRKIVVSSQREIQNYIERN